MRTSAKFLISKDCFHSISIVCIVLLLVTSNASAEQSGSATQPKMTISELELTNGLPTSLITLADSAPIMLVTAPRHSKDKVLINEFISIDEVSNTPSSIAEMLAFEQGLNINGQPGLFQTLSIRGLARQRVQAYINGMRITSERSAGIAVSFIDPLLLAGAEVTQGPASTYYGSGAIAGGIHLMTRKDDIPWVQGGFGSDGNERVIALGTGSEKYAANIAYRQRDNGESRDGVEKNNQFSQHSLSYLRHFNVGGYNIDWQLIESSANNIGKDNSRFSNNRITSYPQENHWLSQLTVSTDAQWIGRVYLHQQDLQTKDLRSGDRVNVVDTHSLDIGMSWENQWETESLSGLYGVDYFARRNVSSEEVETDLNTFSFNRTVPLSGGEENETAIFATVNHEFETWAIHGGLRSNYQSQKSDDSVSISDDFFTYFTTVNKPMGAFDFSLSYGTGFRFASLSERLFSGSTGRGQTVGNADLKPEESASIDLGVAYEIEKLKVEVHRFNTKIDSFIERVSIDDDTRTYQNITSGELSGWQYQIKLFPTTQWFIGFSGQGIHGENELGNPLADIPAKRHQMTIGYKNEHWNSKISWIHRLTKTAIGDGEIVLEPANIAALKVGYKFDKNWKAQLGINNLLNETFMESMDDLSTFASGREFTLNISYFHGQ